MDAGCDFDTFVAQDLIALKSKEKKEMYAVWLCTTKITIIREFTYFKYKINNNTSSRKSHTLKSLHCAMCNFHLLRTRTSLFFLEQITRRNMQYFCFSFDDSIICVDVWVFFSLFQADFTWHEIKDCFSNFPTILLFAPNQIGCKCFNEKRHFCRRYIIIKINYIHTVALIIA